MKHFELQSLPWLQDEVIGSRMRASCHARSHCVMLLSSRSGQSLEPRGVTVDGR